MKKALHILKIVLKDTVMSSEKEYVNEAIKELEDLQNRTCKNCKFGMIDMFDDDIECIKIEAETQGTYFSKDFSCNKWEKNES